MTNYANDVLVSTDWVAEHLDDDRIRIVEVDENPALYAEAHIPGAIGFDWKADLQDPIRRRFLGPAQFAELMGARNLERAHRRALWRPQQLVRRLYVLVLPLLRARGREAHERSTGELDRRRPGRLCRSAGPSGAGVLRREPGRVDSRNARSGGGRLSPRHDWWT